MRVALKDRDADVAFFERIGVAPQRFLHHIAQKRLATMAGVESRTGEQPVQFLAYGFLFVVGQPHCGATVMIRKNGFFGR